jgi:hypothetical protein
LSGVVITREPVITLITSVRAHTGLTNAQAPPNSPWVNEYVEFVRSAGGLTHVNYVDTKGTHTGLYLTTERVRELAKALLEMTD